MVVDKRGRYYAPMMLVVLYTTMLSLVVAFEVKRHQAVVAERVRTAMALGEMKWNSPVLGVIDEILHLGLFDDDSYISAYDELFMELSDKHRTDWRLLSAMAYVESRFSPYAQSRTGALGMMQIMPRTAVIYSIPIEQLSNPRVNIEAANLHYNDIKRMLQMPRDISSRDRAALILASYNGGVGRVFDAMRLARAEGHDPHEWRVIRRYLALLRLPYYYQRDDVNCGRFRTAYTTIRYVEDVLGYYDLYREKTSNSSIHLLPMSSGNESRRRK